MFRPPTFGGLGVDNVKWKAMAVLIRTFLKTECIPKFQTSLYRSLSEKEWYRLLVESMNGGRCKYISFHAELKSHITDWEKSWRLARLKGLVPENISFPFKLIDCHSGETGKNQPKSEASLQVA